MEVFLGELFGGVAGGVDDANWVVLVENRDGQGAGPAGVGTGLGEATGTGHHEGGLGGAENELYGASVGGRERERSVYYPRGRQRYGGEVSGAYEADPIRF